MAGKSNLSIQEIMDTLQKSGAVGGTSYDLAANRGNVQTGVTSALTTAANPALETTKANYMAQIDKIAAMDGKLAGVYGDPTSPLYIERASTRDNAVNMGNTTGYKAGGTIADSYTLKKQQLQDNIQQTLATYDELTKLTRASEVQVKGNKKVAKDLGTGTGTGSDYFTTAELKKLERAGIDPTNTEVAGKFIFGTDTATQDEVINQVLNKKLKTVDSKTIDSVNATIKKQKADAAAKAAADKKAAAAKQKKALF